ncbi:hypothetical protein [Kineosporia mesophila]|nr:hypothetical protein [Kineosporia mesophila]MCD5348602.1 hypothetical protein [Kineosporia mesophila]
MGPARRDPQKWLDRRTFQRQQVRQRGPLLQARQARQAQQARQTGQAQQA